MLIVNLLQNRHRWSRNPLGLLREYNALAELFYNCPQRKPQTDILNNRLSKVCSKTFDFGWNQKILNNRFVLT